MVSASTRKSLLAAITFLVCAVACGPTPSTSRAASPISSPSAVSSSPSITPNPIGLGPNDCTAPPTTDGSTVHSSELAITVTLPAGWAENPTDEGKQGIEAGFAVESGSAPRLSTFTGDLLPATLTMSPREVIDSEASSPGSGTVLSKGECTIAGSQAAYFETSIELDYPGLITQHLSGGGYEVVIAHGGRLVQVAILFSPASLRATTMPLVKSILGSWQWDTP
jgi:hypothetical protein